MMFFVSFVKPTMDQTADLIPPFYPNSKNKIAYWDIGGAAIVEEETIILVPPIQYKKGSAWSALPLPYGSWEMVYEMKISQGNGGGGFAIPVVSQHGSDGSFYGISPKFTGVVLAGAVFADKDGNPRIHYNLYQSNGTETHNVLKEEDKCAMTFPITDEYFRVSIKIDDKTVSAYHNSTTIINTPLTADISRAWIGISAMCDDYTSRIELLSAMYNTEDILNKQRKEAWVYQGMPPTKSDSVSPEKIQKLRNPSFALMRKEFKLFEDAKGNLKNTDKSIEDYLKITQEFAEAVGEVATYGQLNNFITNTLVPYAEGWHRRTFKIMESVNKANKIMSTSLNETQALLTIFNETIYESLNKARTKISSIKNILVEESEVQLLDQIQTLKQSTHPIVNMMKYICITEVVGMIVFGILQNTTWFRNKFIG